MEFREVVRKRRSTRRYTGQPVEREKLQRAMELALLSPSSKNTRSTRLMAVRDLKRVHELGKLRLGFKPFGGGRGSYCRAWRRGGKPNVANQCLDYGHHPTARLGRRGLSLLLGTRR